MGVAHLEHPDFLRKVCEWAWERCRDFPIDKLPTDFEHSLEFTALHASYRDMFEARATDFIAERGVDEECILDKAKALLDSQTEYSPVHDALTQSEDYVGFVTFMQRTHKRLRWAEGL